LDLPRSITSRTTDLELGIPRRGIHLNECHFYHTMVMPIYGLIEGDWDLRAGVSSYLGGVDLAGRRVLEIGPASGFLSFQMEQRGADVLSIEIPDDPGWDFVPYPSDILNPVFEPRRQIMQKVKNSYWFSHEAFGSKAQLMYADAYRLPDALGVFDVALLGSLLLHCRDPLQIVEQCAARASTLIITDLFFPELEGSPVCRLVPTAENRRWDTWWQFSTEFFSQFLKVIDFTCIGVSTHAQSHHGRPYTLFTITAQKGR
jgi:hypothetical protein